MPRVGQELTLPFYFVLLPNFPVCSLSCLSRSQGHYQCNREGPGGEPCGATFVFVADLVRHVEEVHEASNSSAEEDVEEGAAFRCAVCSEGFDDERSYLGHRTVSCSSSSSSCDPSELLMLAFGSDLTPIVSRADSVPAQGKAW
jgi:hypothetical protein